MGKLNYLKDQHLSFLSSCTNEELSPLVNIITHTPDGDLRDSEDLTLQPEYQQHAPNHRRYWKLIAADYQYFGGNTIANAWRGHGVAYKEILSDVCSQMKAPHSSSIDLLERNLIEKFSEKLLDQLSVQDAKTMLQSARIPVNGLSKQAMLIALQTAIRAGGFSSYQFAVIVANGIAKQLLGHGLRLGANAALTRGMSVLAGPVGIAISGLWTAISLAGPAYRVTVPATIYIALLRKIKNTPTCISCDQPIESNAKYCQHCGTAQR